MKHASFFTGIGGFDLAAQWIGWENIFQVEKDEWCRKVLAKNFPNVKRYGDIKEFDGTKYRGAIDILTGGFPCQPYSTAGKRKGTQDRRHLWPEYLRCIGEIQAPFVVGENVHGLINWSGGMVFEQIQVDLENQGYEVASVILPACGKDAGHKRERIWFVAYNNRFRCNRERNEVNTTETGFDAFNWLNTVSSANDMRIGIQGQLSETFSGSEGATGRQTEQQLTDSFQRSDTFEPKLCRTLHGIPFGVDRIRGLGNAIVPQVAYEIFKAIDSFPN